MQTLSEWLELNKFCKIKDEKLQLTGIRPSNFSNRTPMLYHLSQHKRKKNTHSYFHFEADKEEIFILSLPIKFFDFLRTTFMSCFGNSPTSQQIFFVSKFLKKCHSQVFQWKLCLNFLLAPNFKIFYHCLSSWNLVDTEVMSLSPVHKTLPD